jgi:ubiquinone/menaquinone biosynthesis C-methylase UbiE
MPKIEPFESFSEAYDEWFERNEEKYRLELEAIKVFIHSGRNGLEVGVGSGRFAAPLGIKTGIEPSDKMARKARSLGIEVIKGVAEALPFTDARFDFVLMVTTICFVDDIQKAFKEAYRVLKKDGFIVIGFVDKESQLGKEYQKNKEKSKFYQAATFFSTREVLEHLKDAGFGNFEIKQTLLPSRKLK